MKDQPARWMNIKNCITGVTALALSLVCFGAIFVQGYEKRLLMAGVFLMIAGLASIFMAIKGARMEHNKESDIEKRKDKQLCFQISNRLLFSATLLSILLYGITRIQVFLILGIVLCGLTIGMLIFLFIRAKR